MDKLDIIIIEAKHQELKGVTFVDYHKMLENQNSEEIICDFGVYVSDKEYENEMKIGDLMMGMDGDDLLACTAAQVRNMVDKQGMDMDRVSITLGRKKKRKEEG